MPPLKKPKSLESLSLNAAASLVLKACTNIEEKYGNVDEEICRCKLRILQSYLLSNIRPLFDVLCRVVLDVHLRRDKQTPKSVKQYQNLEDSRILFSVMLCEETKIFVLKQRTKQYRLNLTYLTLDAFWKSQISNLKNIVILDITQVTLSDEIFKEISKVCSKLTDISVQSNLEYSSKDSVYQLIECQELKRVRIDFVRWFDKRDIIDCIKAFVRTLGKLQDIRFNEMGTVLLGETKLTSLLSLTEKCINQKSLTNIVHLCPSLIHLDINSHFSSQQEKDRMLEILGASSLPIQKLCLRHFSFTPEMTNLLKLKGKKLLRLTLSLNAGTITSNDINTIGVFCPFLEELEIIELFTIIPLKLFGVPKFQSQIRNTHPRMFINLKSLFVSGNSKWDQNILPQILTNANKLKHVNLANVSTSKVDMLSGILEANPLKELQSFRVISERYGNEMSVPTFYQRSIQRLIDSCSKLIILELECVFEDDAIRYLEDLKRKIQEENLELGLSYKQVKYAFNVFNVHAPSDYILYDEY